MSDMCYNRTLHVNSYFAKIAHTSDNRSVKPLAMWGEWIERGLHKDGKDQYGLAGALGVDRSAVSKIIGGTRQLKANEIAKVAAYLDEPPPSVEMPVRYTVGAGQVLHTIDEDDAVDYWPVSGMWGVEAELAVVVGDSMWPIMGDQSKLIFGRSREPQFSDHNKLRVVRLADDRVMIKIMKRTSDVTIWSLESTNAPPIDDVVVVTVAPILRIEPADT